jgi:hypothetical protein
MDHGALTWFLDYWLHTLAEITLIIGKQKQFAKGCCHNRPAQAMNIL